MRTLIKATVVLFLLSGGGVSAKAILYVGGGASVPVAPDLFKDLWGVGYNVGGGIGFTLRKGLVLHPSVEYASHPLDEDAFLANIGASNIPGVSVRGVSVNTLHVHANLRAKLTDRRMSPYVLAGAGLIHLSASDITATVGGQAVTQAFTETETKLGFGLGAGLDVPLSERTGLFVEMKWLIGLTEVNRTQTLLLRAGLAYAY